ncbi:hypothetical protein L3Q82_013203 [Scortum barcoo]|uniref:Uncharacterized protein n=1 Tax=Scortum barcoo TaxID=214431 RepID=A0ACB8VZX1_9TELE|nr:hypothetical protein L3Q82_013203 [Scortum barcoo]
MHFSSQSGTLDQLYTPHRVLEGLWEFAQPVHMCFVDLEKAFDRVPRGILWGVLPPTNPRPWVSRPEKGGVPISGSCSWSEGKMEREIGGQVDWSSLHAVMWSVYQTVVVKKELKSKGEALYLQSSQLRWLGHLFRMPPGRLPRKVFQACPTVEEAPGKTQDTLERLSLSAGLGVPPASLLSFNR